MMAPFVLTTTEERRKRREGGKERPREGPMVDGAKRMRRAPSSSGRPCVIISVTFVSHYSKLEVKIQARSEGGSENRYVYVGAYFKASDEFVKYNKHSSRIKES